ncbi:MAG TPA: diacylglycerol kinase family protein [Thermoanaerobaculia bacterium]|nr:diacylglycerol kinase family protein [Thermoanaerobaculia bacterium]
MPTPKGLLFFNNQSGMRLPSAELLAAVQDAGLEIATLDAVSTIRARMAEGHRLFVAAGGDGTVHHVMQSLVNTDAMLGVIPLGTYNHFAKDLGIPLDWRAALETAVSGTTLQIDAARANERFFVNNLSMGLYPELVARREQHGRDYPRWKARLLAAYGTFRKYPHVTLNLETEHHQEVVRTHVFMVSNNTYDLSRIGVEAPRTRLTEGRLSVYWLPHLPRVQLMKFVAHYLAGRVHEAPGFRSFRTLRMKVQSPRMTLHVGLDGELFEMATPMVITIVPQGLLVKVPRD